ncbi:MAG TPA: TadE/TadG family type IV pilus assembly protein [Streptosporangiaceae bacterium]|nr:TadE/TadG family type IV pilus assembly protein [Streptosporangiaceae bacterium]
MSAIIRRGRRDKRRPKHDRGSMAVEFAVAGPLLVVLMLLIAAGGEWIDYKGEVSAAARDAVRAASLARQFGDAQTFANQAAQQDLGGLCQGGNMTTTVSLLGSGNFATAQDVQVTVTCQARLPAFHDLGIDVNATFTDTATAALDPFVERQG